MDLYGKKSSSIPQKIVILFLETFLLGVSCWILFDKGFYIFASIFGLEKITGNENRRILLFVFNCVVYIRMWITIAYLLKRAVPWEEAFSIPFAFALYYLGFALLSYQSKNPINFFDILAVIIFIAGSVLNTAGELQRDRWKKNPANKGHLFTGGFFKYSMHINYFGDLLWVIGYTIVTNNIYAIIIPIFIFCFFVFYNIPKLDSHLSEKYQDEFTRYSKNTKKFIPYFY